MKSGDLKWIAASGVEGAKSVTIPVKENGDHRVKLHFMEPEDIGKGERVFDVSLQGQPVLRGLDIADLAGGSRRAIVRECAIHVEDQELRLELSPRGKRPAVLSGIQWQRNP